MSMWKHPVNVRKFVLDNVTPYEGGPSFLEWPTEKTKKLWDICKQALKEEMDNKWCRGIDTEHISTIISHTPWYISKDLEVIVGLQTDELLKRAMKPFGWYRVVEAAVKERGLEVSPKITEIFHYAKSHNDAVFDAYDDEIRKFRSKHIVTGLPDNYARGRIIGDYRRLALYGADYLIESKKEDKTAITGDMTEEKVRLREEVAQQIRALEDIKLMAASYGIDVSKPAQTAQQAVQFVYFAYLAAIKEQDGAAMSLGNTSTFLDIYIEKDIQSNKITEAEAQELIDQFVMKLRMVRHLRAGAYDDIFGGDPTWVTEAIGGQFTDWRTKVTKTSFRFLQTLYNLGPSPEPNLTILWYQNLPEKFKDFCAKVSIDTSSLQYENDDLMRDCRGSDDYGIACCVSHQELGKRIQHFGARCNLPKALLMAINAGCEEHEGEQLLDMISPLSSKVLDYNEVMTNFKKIMKEVARVYAKAMFVIHYMHDKYYYERAQMAFVDTHHGIDIAYGIAGISIIADSLSAIKYAKVTPIRNDKGIAIDFQIEWDFPKFGNDDDKVDDIAQEISKYFFEALASHTCYKNANPTMSLLTITSNVMYGKATWATPDGRKESEAFAPGANPMHGRDNHWALASLNSVAKFDYAYAQDGISNTFSIVPATIGANEEEQIHNLVSLIGGYFSKEAHHLNVNVLNRETLLDAYEHPENYPQLTIRVSGYAVNFVRLSKAHQQEVIARTFHKSM